MLCFYIALQLMNIDFKIARLHHHLIIASNSEFTVVQCQAKFTPEVIPSLGYTFDADADSETIFI